MLKLTTDIKAPEYVRDNPFTDISSAYPESVDNADSENVDVLNSWPSKPSASLDGSQWAALQRILTKELAIVQGPPGTGKTHVSVVALKILLQNWRPGQPPIIIAAHTNHALDQLLLHVSDFEEYFLRLGGRTQDRDVIKQRTLYNVRKSWSLPNIPGCLKGPSFKQQKDLKESLMAILTPLAVSGIPLGASLFHQLGLLTLEQLETLEKRATDYVYSEDEELRQEPIAAWLGDELVEASKGDYGKADYGFEDEEIDLEFEQLKELEAEIGINEDEFDDSLSGPYVALEEPWTGRNRPGHNSTNDIEKWLESPDLFDVPLYYRGSIYKHLQKKAKEILLSAFRAEASIYSRVCRDLQIGKWEVDSSICSMFKVIGVTATGLSKYRALLASLNPRILVIEEAAEVLEAPVVAGCFESLQHLVLVGDHQQLRTQCADQELAGEPYNLSVSLFERLVQNKMPFSTMTRQRRMDPEIRRLLSPIYKVLDDHPSVRNRDAVPGMGGLKTFFLSHKWPESKDENLSSRNTEEARMITKMFEYLVLNGTDPSEITVLTFYNGQRKLILRLLRNSPQLSGGYLKVVTVDSYQGEENKVVLLSLVRSNSDRKVGFLDIANRVCVALSRAKRGFYIFGNAENLCLSSALWWQVVQIMGSNPRRIGFALPIACERHGRKMWMKEPDSFDGLTGGCTIACPNLLPCGHRCPLNCHPFAEDLVKCNEPCSEVLECGHPCEEICNIKPCHCTKDHSLTVSPSKRSIERAKARNTQPSGSAQRRVSHSSPIISYVTNYPELPQPVSSISHEFSKKWQDYADDGARRADADLAKKAADLDLQAREQQQRDSMEVALFGRGQAIRGSESFQQRGDGRGKWVEEYVPAQLEEYRGFEEKSLLD